MHALRTSLLEPIVALWRPGVVARIGGRLAWVDELLDEVAADAEVHRFGDDVDRIAEVGGVDLLVVARAQRPAVAVRALDAVWAGDGRRPGLAVVIGTGEGVGDAVHEARTGWPDGVEMRSIAAFGGALLLHHRDAPLTPAQRELLDDWRLGPGPSALVEALEAARIDTTPQAATAPPPPEGDLAAHIAALEDRIRELADARARLEAEAVARESRLELLRAELAVLHRLVDAPAARPS